MLIIPHSKIPCTWQPSQAEGTCEWLGWPVQPAGLALEERIVHVWSFSLRASSIERSSLEQILSFEERERAACLKNREVQNSFIIARGRLRQILGHCLDRVPQNILFEYGPQGKPSILTEAGHPRLTFNLAHSGDIGLVAIGMNRDVGIDHERTHRVSDEIGISERYFSKSEARYIRSLPLFRRGEEFLKLWTCKEAYVKATGMGLSCPLDSFEVVFSSSPERGVIIGTGDSSESWQYGVHLLPPCTRFLGAVVSPGQDWILNYWHWPELNT